MVENGRGREFYTDAQTLVTISHPLQVIYVTVWTSEGDE